MNVVFLVTVACPTIANYALVGMLLRLHKEYPRGSP